jgi:peptidyl-prolyl cis-trans isomerase D
MFEFIRTHTRWVLGFVLLLIIPSFVFFGVENYMRFRDGATAAVAKVDGRDITRAEWDQAHQRNVERVRRQRPDVDARLLDNPEFRRESLDGLVRERVLLAAANQLHLVPGDERLQRLFLTDPQFAPLRNADGSVNRDLLASQGMSSEMFAQQLRMEFAMRQVLAGVAQSALAPAAAAAPSLDALLQRREVQLQPFDAVAYRAKVNPSDADLEAFHKAHEADFRAPEQATIEYVVLDVDALGRDVSVPEEDLRRYYAENASRYTTAEERRASHILVKADKDAPAAERDKAKAKAEALLAQLRKNPAAFAELARKNSDDPGSAARGGDLDFFGRGAMVKPFEDAVFAMKAGEISNVVQSDFGFHIITLAGQRGGEKKAFEAVRPAIEAEVRKSLALKRYAEAAEQFTNLVYEQPDSLQPVVDKLKLEKRTAVVQRSAAAGATGPLASAKLLEAVFSADSVRNKRNTNAIDVGASQLAAARVVEYRPSQQLPLAEVRDRVRERVVSAQAAAMARQEGQARLAQLRQSADGTLPITRTLSRAQPQGLPRAAIDSVLGADASRLPATVGVDLGEQGFLVARVVRVLERETGPADGESLRQQYTEAWASAEAQAYLGALKSRFKAQVVEHAVAQAASGAAP